MWPFIIFLKEKLSAKMQRMKTTLGKETVILRGSCNILRYNEIVKGFPKIPGLGDQVDGVYAIRLREHRQSSRKERKRQDEKEGKRREWYDERDERKFVEAEAASC